MPGPKNKPGSAAEEAPPGDDVNKSSEAQITKINDARCHRACPGWFANDCGRVPLSLI